MSELNGKLQAWVARRLEETGRERDPVAVQGASGKRIGKPIPGEKIGPGATPLHKRKKGMAASIPAPDELDGQDRQPNERKDEVKGVKLHGYVKQ